MRWRAKFKNAFCDECKTKIYRKTQTIKETADVTPPISAVFLPTLITWQCNSWKLAYFDHFKANSWLKFCVMSLSLPAFGVSWLMNNFCNIGILCCWREFLCIWSSKSYWCIEDVSLEQLKSVIISLDADSNVCTCLFIANESASVMMIRINLAWILHIFWLTSQTRHSLSSMFTYTCINWMTQDFHLLLKARNWCGWC